MVGSSEIQLVDRKAAQKGTLQAVPKASQRAEHLASRTAAKKAKQKAVHWAATKASPLAEMWAQQMAAKLVLRKVAHLDTRSDAGLVAVMVALWVV